jgi:cyclopropane-fatty-acyl-phospholipid synthase
MSTTVSLTHNAPASALIGSERTHSGVRSAAWLDSLAKRFLMRALQAVSHGAIQLQDENGAAAFGRGGTSAVTVRVRRPAFYRHVLMGGTLSAAESWLQGDWDCDDLTALFRIILQNRTVAKRLNGPGSRLMAWLHRWWHARQSNTREGSRRNIHAHYDLGNEFFRLMLDETMAYSSGIFATSQTSLQDASIEKFDRLCRGLDLQPHHHLLEIGTGWGGLAEYAASRFGCRVTTTTISQQQYDAARQRIAEAGLSDRVTLLLQDYRDLQGRFDRIVSVEMIEAVGHQFLDTYFSRCSALLTDDGAFALQSITMPDQGYEQYLKSVDFIQKYVFPGGCLPSVSSILNSVSRVTDLRLARCEDFGPHYARTIREWRSRFHAHLDEVRGLGYPDRFIRLWDYYLSYCEAGFDEHHTGLVQLRFDKPGCRLESCA